MLKIAGMITAKIQPDIPTLAIIICLSFFCARRNPLDGGLAGNSKLHNFCNLSAGIKRGIIWAYFS